MIVSEDQLVSELWARDVRFITGESLTGVPTLSPKVLLALLAQSTEARVRLSLIPLLLRHPEFANEAKEVDRELSTPDANLFFRFYFTATMLFQQMYKEKLSRFLGSQPTIPDLFSSELGVTLTQNLETSLFELAQRHKILSGQKINWLGTYRHAPDVWLKQLELRHSQSRLK